MVLASAFLILVSSRFRRSASNAAVASLNAAEFCVAMLTS